MTYEKNNLLSLGNKLDPHELKNIMGGSGYVVECWRKRLSDNAYFFFTTDSIEVGAAWESVWFFESGWDASCSYRKEIPPIKQITYDI